MENNFNYMSLNIFYFQKFRKFHSMSIRGQLNKIKTGFTITVNIIITKITMILTLLFFIVKGACDFYKK